MLKKFLAIIAGYLVMAIFMFIAFTVAYRIMGADNAFEPGVYTVSTLWIIISIIVNLIAAIIGGIVCMLIFRHKSVPIILAILILILGLTTAFLAPQKANEAGATIRSGEVSNLEAMNRAQQPTWLIFLNPILGVAGVLLGAKMIGCAKKE